MSSDESKNIIRRFVVETFERFNAAAMPCPFDVTTRTWQLRHLVRAVAQLAPLLVAIYLLLPGPPWVRGCAVLGGALIGLFYSMVYAAESAEHRTLKAGYPRGTPTRVREEANAEERAERAQRYAERWRGEG